MKTNVELLNVRHLLPIAVGLRGLVVLDELVVHELQRERGLADTAGAHHDHLVQRRLRGRLLRHRATPT